MNVGTTYAKQTLKDIRIRRSLTISLPTKELENEFLDYCSSLLPFTHQNTPTNNSHQITPRYVSIIGEPPPAPATLA